MACCSRSRAADVAQLATPLKGRGTSRRGGLWPKTRRWLGFCARRLCHVGSSSQAKRGRWRSWGCLGWKRITAALRVQVVGALHFHQGRGRIADRVRDPRRRAAGVLQSGPWRPSSHCARGGGPRRGRKTPRGARHALARGRACEGRRPLHTRFTEPIYARRITIECDQPRPAPGTGRLTQSVDHSYVCGRYLGGRLSAAVLG